MAKTHSQIQGDAFSIVKTFERDSDRGVILTGSALLDELLADLIAALCIDGEIAKVVVGGYEAPIGTFSSRITMAYALGLISKQEREHLDWVRELRNKAAHFDRKQHGFNVLFDSSFAQELLKKFTITQTGLVAQAAAAGPSAVAKATFTGCVVEFILRLTMEADTTKRRAPCPERPNIWDQAKP